MDIKISNMLRIREAQLSLEPGRITCVTGRNASGKTSIATIAGALLAGDPNPAGASKAQGKVYVRDGTDAGLAELFLDGSDVAEVRWLAQSGELAVREENSPSSAGAVGLVDFTGQLSPAARTALWEEYFLPPLEYLDAKFREALAGHVDPKLIEDLMTHLHAEGDFTGIVRAYQTRMRDEKRQWTRYTGEEWGSRKAADWVPQGWLAELDTRTNEDMVAEFHQAEQVLRAAQIAHAVDASVIERAEQARRELPSAQAELEQAADAQEQCWQALDELKREADQLKSGQRVALRLYEDTRGKLTRAQREREALREPTRDESSRAIDYFEKEILETRKSISFETDHPPVKVPVEEAPHECPACYADLQISREGHVELWDAERAKTYALDREKVEKAAWEAELEGLREKLKALEFERDDIEASAHDQFEKSMAKYRATVVELDEKIKALHEEAGARKDTWEATNPADDPHKDDIEKARHTFAVARERAKNADLEVAVLVAAIAEADGKVEKTEEMMNAQVEAETNVERVRTQRKMVSLRLDAQAAHKNIIAYQTIAQILGPRGIRAQCVEEAMGKFHGVLTTIAAVTGWPEVKLDRHYSVSIGERSLLRLCAESERLRAQWSLQIAIARVLREPVVILDAADHLDYGNLAALRALLTTLAGRPKPPAFLVCATEMETHNWNPDGLNYALDDGTLKELG